jgi:hypothetical protein
MEGMDGRTVLAALLVALPARAADGPPGAEPRPAMAASVGSTLATSAGSTAEAAASLLEIDGTVSSVDRALRRVEVATKDGPVVLSYDRDTLVYRPGGATTVLDIAPGMALKAGLDAARVAYWIQVRPTL